MADFKSMARVCALALMMWGCFAAASSAQNAPTSAVEPKPDAGTGAQANCIDENDGYKMSGKTPTFFISLENKCERRMSCRVYAYVTSARGPAQGHGRLELAPKSRGAAAKKSFTMRVKMIGGNSQSDRECRAL